MSNLEQPLDIDVCGGRQGVAAEPVFELLAARPVLLTPRQWTGPDGASVASPLTVSRLLPTQGRRMVGAWCFVDFYGPADVSGTEGMQVPPHPHCGLQTVSWLLAGQVLHRDSLGSVAVIEPGQLNLMTSGNGIAHAETSAQHHSPTLHGVQLWVALPEAERDRAAAFEQHMVLPQWREDGTSGTVLLGSFDQVHSPATVYTPIVGVDFELAAGAAPTVPLRPEFEHAVLVTDGSVELEGREMSRGDMAYLGCGRSELAPTSDSGARLLLIGGEPFDEAIVMWWNFIGRSHDDIVRAREDWMSSGSRFGSVASYPGDALPAPPMPPLRLKPRRRS
jgi:redox-sensitive bicupin YhaK (pirin superfamily)